MNRAIKFRVWDGKSINYNPIFSRDWTSNINTQLNERLAENGVVLMQFTGLLDKNGKEIYEGDIIDYKFPDAPHDPGRTVRGHIEYIEDIASFRCATDQGDFPIHDDVGTFVLGNRFENPELLTPPSEQ